MKNQKVYINYHMNPAVIKSHLSSLSKEQLSLHGRYIRLRAWNSKAGSNQRAMFVGLYQYCKRLYIEKFKA